MLTYAFRVERINWLSVLLIAVIAAVFRNFSRVFQSRQLSQISFYAVYLLMMALTLKTFAAVVEWTEEGVHMLTALWALSALCTCGGLRRQRKRDSGCVYQLVLFLIYLTELLIANVLLPMIHIYMIVRVLNDLSRENYLTKFCRTDRNRCFLEFKSAACSCGRIQCSTGNDQPAIDSVKRSILARGAEAIPGVGDALGGMAEVAAEQRYWSKTGSVWQEPCSVWRFVWCRLSRWPVSRFL